MSDATDKLVDEIRAAERKRCAAIVRGYVERDGDDCVERTTTNLVIDQIIVAIEAGGAV